MYDEDFAITPFDPANGIWFRYGRIFSDRGQQLADFQQETGYILPGDFLEMIGEYCEGGFDGHYRVFFADGVEVQWHHLLLMKQADKYDTFGHDTLAILRAKPEIFKDRTNRLIRFPFGEAYAASGRDEFTKGCLAFDKIHQNAVVFLSDNGEQQIKIAKSFRDMMLGSHFVFYG